MTGPAHPIVAITGASGSCYGVRLLESLIAAGVEPYVVVSPAGRQVMALEMGSGDLKDHLGSTGWREEDVRDLASPLASGSFPTTGMVIAPCSTGTLGSVANGISSNLIHRAAEVCLKERRALIVVPRETPLSTITLQNMLTLAQAGAHVVPANPGFYHNPKQVSDLVDFMVARVLDLMKVPHNLSRRWTGMPALDESFVLRQAQDERGRRPQDER
ncbi:MAG: UbiX family flavin prenyltransferase [Candidatus Omnitrophica bacterium]|nr:UbiX family flavin prenyltransferase [Candidatus Omnitrophota bacterium]